MAALRSYTQVHREHRRRQIEVDRLFRTDEDLDHVKTGLADISWGTGVAAMAQSLGLHGICADCGLRHACSGWARSCPYPHCFDVTVGSGYPAGLIDISPPVSRNPFFAQGKIVLTVPVYDTGYAAGVDIYFGVIMPGGTRVKTWSLDNTGKVTLNDGFTPIARAYSVSSPGTFDTTSVNAGELITYTFNGSEEKGLYLVFIKMVPTGTVLTDVITLGAHPRSWKFPTAAHTFSAGVLITID